jgi:hypothetical protein
VNKALVRFEVRRRRWLFPPLVRIKTPDPVRRNRLEVALWVFNLNLPDLILRGTANSSQQITQNTRENELYQKIVDPFLFWID